jgi:DNA-nicking Smr family endonuclease
MPNRASNGAREQRDRALWREAVRNITPLRGRAAEVPLEPASAQAYDRSLVGEDRADRTVAAPTLDRFSGIDRANAERLKRGHHPIEGRLDLHGMSQVKAHRALVEFIRISRDAGRRCVLVITGRGLGPSGSGVLKGAIPRWLEEPELRRQILARAPAQPRHGGAGALYLLLRRRR